MSMHNDAPTAVTLTLQEQPKQPDVHVLAGRIGATILDFIPLGILVWLVDSTFGVELYQSSVSAPPGIPFSSSTAVTGGWLYLVLLIYYTVQEALFSTTFGKFVAGLKVVRDDGRPITIIQALVRNIVRPIDAASGYLLGWIIALCSSRRRRLGDHLARTLVVSAESVPRSSLSRSQLVLCLSTLPILYAGFVIFCLGFQYYARPPLVVQSLANPRATSSILNNSGTVTDLSLGQPTRSGNTITYPVSFYVTKHGYISKCQGHVILTWQGFGSSWQATSSDSTCQPSR